MRLRCCLFAVGANLALSKRELLPQGVDGSIGVRQLPLELFVGWWLGGDRDLGLDLADGGLRCLFDRLLLRNLHFFGIRRGRWVGDDIVVRGGSVGSGDIGRRIVILRSPLARGSKGCESTSGAENRLTSEAATEFLTGVSSTAGVAAESLGL